MMSRKNFAYVISVFILTIGVIGCSSSAKLGEHIPIASAGANVIVIGTGGGFSGFYDGFVLAESGNAYSWRSTNEQPDTLIHICDIGTDSSRFFFQYLREIGFRYMVSNVGGNMNAFIEHRTAEDYHRVSWDMDNPPNIPALSLFYTLMRKHIERNVSK